MKKLCAVGLLIIAVVGAASGIELSAGGGMSVGGVSQKTQFEPYVIIPGFWEYDSYTVTMASTPFAFSAWFDATYAVASFGFQATGSPHQTIVTVDGGTRDTNETDVDERAGFLSFCLLGRYPFALGPVSLFPLLGIEYDLNVYLKAADGTDVKAGLPEAERPWLNQLWFKAGVGADIAVYKGLFIRPQVLMGFKVLNQGEKDYLQTGMTAFDATVARTTDFIIEAGLQAGWRF